MNFGTSSLLPKPCLSKQDEEYLRQNEAWADRTSYLGMYSIVFICLLIIGIYLWYLIEESSNPNFNLMVEIVYHNGWLILIPIIFLISNLNGVVIKHRVDAFRKRRNKC